MPDDPSQDPVDRVSESDSDLQPTRSIGPADARSSGGTAGVEQWGDLILLEPIGTGARGEVWRAWDSTLQREVALKFLQASATATGIEPRVELLNEARALARIRHRGVVAVYGIAEHDGRTGLWMERLQGPTLAREIGNLGALPPQRVVQIGLQLCSSLEALESAGLVHRDIKPSNIVLEADGRVVLTDFGLGWRPALDDADAPGISGTPIFMPPEILAGEPASARSDLYALGVTLWWSLVGTPPFRGATLPELKKAVARGPHTSLAAARPDAPSGLVRAIEWAMRPSPAERPASAAALADALRSAGDEFGGAKKRPARTWPWRWVGLAGASLALLLAAVWVGKGIHARHELPSGGWTAQRFSLPGPVLDTDHWALSPDGRKVAYLPDSATISVMSLGSTDSRVLDHLEPEDGTYVGIAWNADGTNLIATRCDRGGNATAVRVDAVTGTRSVLAGLGPLGPDQAEDVRMVLSPNGTRMAVRRAYRRQTGEFAELDVVDLPAGTERCLVRGEPDHVGPPTWAPNSNRIAYTLERGNREYSRIETCDLRGARTIVLEDSTGGLAPYAYPHRSLGWLSENRLVYSIRSHRQGQLGDQELWAIRMDPATGRRLGRPALLYAMAGAQIHSPSISSDGRRIAFDAMRNTRELKFIDTSGQPRFQTLTARSQLTGLQGPVWSPNGLGLFVKSDGNSEKGSIGRIRLSDGRFELLLPASTTRDYPMSLSPDGKILFCAIGPRLVALPLSGGAPRTMADPFVGIVLCARSGRCLAVEHARDEFVVRDFDPAAGPGSVRFRYPARGFEERFRPTADLSPDGLRLALLRPDGSGYDILDSTNGRELGRVNLPAQAFPQSVRWSADGSSLYCSGLNALAPYWIAHVGPSGVDRLVWRDDAVWPGEIAVSPDGSQLAFTSISFDHELWMIERP